MKAIYIISSKENAKKNIYKPGIHSGTENKLISRYSTYLINPKIYYFKYVKNAGHIENILKSKLKMNRLTNNKGNRTEWVSMNLKILITKIEKIIELVNSITSEESEESEEIEDIIVYDKITLDRINVINKIRDAMIESEIYTGEILPINAKIISYLYKQNDITIRKKELDFIRKSKQKKNTLNKNNYDKIIHELFRELEKYDDIEYDPNEPEDLEKWVEQNYGGHSKKYKKKQKQIQKQNCVCAM